MSVAALLDETYRQVVLLAAEPRCGEDFCDQCGDCLHCYSEDPCCETSTGRHSWVIYADKVAEFRAEHPEAKPVTD